MSTIKTQELNYDTKCGPLADTYKLFVPSTINTGAQISYDRITDLGLREMSFYTANVSLATKRNGKLLLAIGENVAFNVVFGANSEEVCEELIKTDYILLDHNKRDSILRLEKLGEIVFVEPKYLCLTRNEPNCGYYFPIRAKSYEKDVTFERMPFVIAAFGYDDILRKVMNNFVLTQKDYETWVFTMNIDRVAENVKDNEIVAQTSMLENFNCWSRFHTGFRSINAQKSLRGLLKNPAKIKKSNDIEDLV